MLQPGLLFVSGFEGTSPEPKLSALLEGERLSGFVFFRRNVEAPARLAELTAALWSAAQRLPPLLAVDQEGGRVQRLPWSDWPSAAELGRTESEPLCEAVGAAMGWELALCGLNWDLAPVLDLETNPENPIIRDRAFGREPEASKWALAWARGLHESGVASCGKHFPGHGDTSEDSHEELPVVALPESRLQARELRPFREAVEQLPAFMTAHVLYPALDPNRPATFSPRILRDLLREQLRFSGLVVSDDLEMQGAKAFGDVPDLAIEALASGVDLLLVCSGPEPALQAAEAVDREARRSSAFRGFVEEALARVERFRSRLVPRRLDLQRALSAFQRARTLAAEHLPPGSRGPAWLSAPDELFDPVRGHVPGLS